MLAKKLFVAMIASMAMVEEVAGLRLKHADSLESGSEESSEEEYNMGDLNDESEEVLSNNSQNTTETHGHTHSEEKAAQLSKDAVLEVNFQETKKTEEVPVKIFNPTMIERRTKTILRRTNAILRTKAKTI